MFCFCFCFVFLLCLVFCVIVFCFVFVVYLKMGFGGVFFVVYLEMGFGTDHQPTNRNCYCRESRPPDHQTTRPPDHQTTTHEQKLLLQAIQTTACATNSEKFHLGQWGNLVRTPSWRSQFLGNIYNTYVTNTYTYTYTYITNILYTYTYSIYMHTYVQRTTYVRRFDSISQD